MANNAVPLTLPVQLMTMPRQFSTVFNGKIYVGRPDTDPTAPANRITVYQESEGNKLIPIAQPIAINSGGYPVINGQVVKLVVTQDYSIAVHDQLGAQVFYFPRCTGPYVSAIFHDQTLHGNGTEADKLGVQLSRDSGNLLEIRKDGLYYGVNATDELLNLYVDAVNGDDSNKGTRASPLKTLNRALTITPDNKSNTIHLHAGQTFYLDRNAVINSCSRTIQPYGDPWIDGDKVPPLTPTNPHYEAWCVKSLARPTIKSVLQYQESIKIVRQYTIVARGGGLFNLRGLIIDCIPENDEQQLTGWQKNNGAPIYGDSSSVANFRGCYLVSKQETDNFYKWVIAGNLAEGNIPTLQFNRCVMLSGQYFINVSGTPTTVSITDDWPPQDEVEYIKGNLVQATKDGKLGGIVRGPNGEPRNLTINFVV